MCLLQRSTLPSALVLNCVCQEGNEPPKFILLFHDNRARFSRRIHPPPVDTSSHAERNPARDGHRWLGDRPGRTGGLSSGHRDGMHQGQSPYQARGDRWLWYVLLPVSWLSALPSATDYLFGYDTVSLPIQFKRISPRREVNVGPNNPTIAAAPALVLISTSDQACTHTPPSRLGGSRAWLR